MNILLTNDDGHFANGILLMREILSKFGRVVIVAPQEVMSAKSVAITLGRGVEVRKIKEDIYAMEGTPADCVAFGLSSLNIKFDLVVSGCNHGFNISYDTMYSGTIGACLQALTYRIPAIAFSGPSNLRLCEKHAEEVLKYIFDNKLLSTEYLLSINFPEGEEVKGIKMTELYYRPENTYYIQETDDTYLAYRELNDEKCTEKNTDVYAIYHGYISITKLHKTL